MLDAISHEMAAAKGMFGTLKTIGVAICIGIWSLIYALTIAWLSLPLQNVLQIVL